jgi:hypothetical protein
MTVQRSFRLLSIILVTVLVSPACYTLVKHPKVKKEGVYQKVEDRKCTNCHYEDEIWSYHHPSNHRLYTDARYANWESYYEMPWWYESYWYYTPPATSTVPPPHRSLRPDAGGGQAGTTGGSVGHPPGHKSQSSSVRTTGTSEAKEGEKDDNKKSKDRTVRPKRKKEKEDG